MNIWLAERKQKSLPLFREVENFCVVNEDLFQEFDAFHARFNKLHGHQVLLPSSPIVVDFLEKNSLPIQTVPLYGEQFIDFPPHLIDDFCDWIVERRSQQN